MAISQDRGGACGAPEHAPGFAITTDGNNVLIGAGRYYVDGILCEMNCGTKIPHARVMKSLQLLCEKVMPRFN